MNKPYVTKYIPVEGEIKEGDAVKSNGYYGKCIGIDPTAQYHVSMPTKEGDTIEYWTSNPGKVKLFLCSRDISIRDKNIHYIHADGEVEIILEIKHEWQLVFVKNMANVNAKDCYKIIGEVSPAAIWVKEGMEFENKDKEELLFHYAHRSFRDKDFEDTDLWQAMGDREYDKYTITVKFKCPTCNTFH